MKPEGRSPTTTAEALIEASIGWLQSARQTIRNGTEREALEQVLQAEVTLRQARQNLVQLGKIADYARSKKDTSRLAHKGLYGE